MANRIRRRNRGDDSDPRTSEDVMAREPDFDYASSGPHVPMLVPPRSTHKKGDEEQVCSFELDSFLSVRMLTFVKFSLFLPGKISLGIM